MINRKMAKIREKFLWTSLYIEIAWLRFKILKLPPLEYIYNQSPLYSRESWPRNGLISP